MGILDFLGGLGQSGGASGMQRLTSGMGSQGGFLQKMGLGQYGSQAGGQAPGMAGQMGQASGMQKFLHGLGENKQQAGQEGAQGGGMSPQQSLMPQGGGGQQEDLMSLIAQYMKQNQRQ